MPQKLNILWLKSGPLHPLDTGGKIRTYNMLRELKKSHAITFLALCPSDTTDSAKVAAKSFSDEQVWIPWEETRKGSIGFFSELAGNFLFSDRPYVIEKYFSRAMADRISALDSSGQFDLIICDFLTPTVNLFTDKKLKTPTLLFEHNVESLIWKRLFENANGVLKRAYFKNQWQRMERFEKEICEQSNAVVGVSEEDCRILKTEFSLDNVLGFAPTGVDLSYFCPSTQPRKPHSLVFLGSMDWMPNIDAVCYFAESIFPLIKQRFADATCTIVGRNPTQRVKELAIPNSGIFVTGTVPDVRPLLAEAEAMIVPLRIGGGTRIKIYEGMATAIPIVSSTIGAEGLPVTHGENIFLADSPEEFARGVADLFEKPDFRKQLGESGRALVQRHFSWEAVTKVFEQYCFKACARSKI